MVDLDSASSRTRTDCLLLCTNDVVQAPLSLLPLACMHKQAVKPHNHHKGSLALLSTAAAQQSDPVPSTWEQPAALPIHTLCHLQHTTAMHACTNKLSHV
jgi:hypothetical protein